MSETRIDWEFALHALIGQANRGMAPFGTSFELRETAQTTEVWLKDKAGEVRAYVVASAPCRGAYRQCLREIFTGGILHMGNSVRSHTKATEPL